MNAEDIIEEIRELHRPLVLPEGMVLIGGKRGKQYCEGCDFGDPFLIPEWPCETRLIADGRS